MGKAWDVQVLCSRTRTDQCDRRSGSSSFGRVSAVCEALKQLILAIGILSPLSVNLTAEKRPHIVFALGDDYGRFASVYRDQSSRLSLFRGTINPKVQR